MVYLKVIILLIKDSEIFQIMQTRKKKDVTHRLEIRNSVTEP